MILAAREPAKTVPAGEVLPPATAAGPAALSVREKPPAPGSARWEMVIPKMNRPVAKPAPAPLPLPAPPAVKSPAPSRFSERRDSRKSTPTLSTRPEPFLSLGWKHILISAVAVGLATWVWLGTETPEGIAPSPGEIEAGSWSRRPARPAGAKAGGEIVTYDGSRDESNYRVEFAWTPGPKGVGMAFRARDAANYYAARLSLLPSKSPSVGQALSAEHFSVLAGVEGKHARKIVTLARKDPEINVRLEASGPAYTLYVQGTPVDYWNDERLTGGTVGFYEERNEPPAVQSLRFTFFKKGAASQTVAASLP